MFWLLLLLGLAVLATGGLVWLALRSPLMVRLGLRNALRHRRQTATVVAGLLVGTMVICASLVAGDSLEQGLRDTALGSLGELDVVVRVPGNLLVPQETLDLVAAEPYPEGVDGVSSVFLDGASVTHTAEDLYEPGAAMIGFDPVADRPFGPFTDAADGAAVYGDDLGTDEVYINAQLADKLDAGPGDTIEITYVRPVLPLVPTLHWLNGTLVSATASPDPSGGYQYVHSTEDVYERTFAVPHSAEMVAAVVFWPDPTNATDLDIELVAPDGTSFVADEGSVAPDPEQVSPVPLPVPVPDPDGPIDAGRENPTFLVLEKEDLVEGEWTLRVHGKGASQQPYRSFAAVFVPEYDLARARAAFETLDETFGGGGFIDDLAPDLANRTGESYNLTVKRVVAMEGKAVFFYSDAVFLQKSDAQRIYGVGDKANWLKVTAVGGVDEGLEESDAIQDAFEGRIDSLARARDASPSSPERNLDVVPLKKDWLEGTEQAAVLFTQFLTLIGSFALVAGLMLIINIFSMLADERRHELGISRAVGMTRRDLVTAFTFEGGVYTLAAAAVGVLAGMLLAWLLVIGINTVSPEDSFFHVPFTPTVSSLVIAFLLGALITFATVVMASYRASRLDIAQAIRGEEDHPRRTDARRARLMGLLFGVLAVAVAIGSFFGSFTAKALGPPLLLFAAGPLLGLVMKRDRAWILVGGTVVVYTLASFLFLAIPAGTEGDVSAAVRGLFLVFGATVLLVHLDRPPRLFAAALGRIRGLAAIARVATTYPLARRGRTGLTLSMYALVILIITMFSVFFTIFTPDLSTQTGGYEVLGETRVVTKDLATVAGVAALRGTDDDPFRDVRRYDVLVDHFEFGDERILINGEPPGEFGPSSSRFVGFDATFARENGFPLDEWDTAHGATEQALWETVAEDTRLVVVSHQLVVDPEQPDAKRAVSGDTLTINTTAGQTDYIIAGIMEQHYFGGVWMAESEVERLFSDLDGLVLFDLEEGADVDAAAKRIERAFRPIGMDAESVAEEARRFDQQTTRIFQLLTAYMSLGLIVGVASIGIMTSRAVLERRRELGMLKAIGFTRRAVASAMLLEVLLILATAAVVGVGLGILVAYAIFTTQIDALPGVTFGIPWWDLVQLLGVAFAATILATVVPLKRAADLPAAEALRTVE